MLLINGCIGIGTGFSTDIPPHDPSEVVGLIKERLSGVRSTLENIALRPWWLGFKGPIQRSDNGVWFTKGVYTFDDAKKMVVISELPIGTWTHDYKEILEELCTINDKESGKPLLKNYEDLYNHVDIRFDLYLDPDYYDDAKENLVEFEKKFKLTSTWRTSNMVAFTHTMQIKKYGCVGDILEEFYVERLIKYEERRKAEIDSLQRDALEADAKARFLTGVLNDTIDLRRKSDTEIVDIMKKHSLPALTNVASPDDVDSYEYLLRLRIDRVKASAIEDALKAVMKATELLNNLEKTTASALWKNDLDEFMTAWESMKSDRLKLLSTVEKVKTKAKK
jgi:DNA topoisomerase-2